jgi:hypothetical protein
MGNDWWPAPLAHVPAEAPWAHEMVTVAEVRSFDGRPHAGHRTTSTALVPIGQVDGVRKALAKLDHEVHVTGPHPFYIEDRPYKPAFWIGAGNLATERYEPLVFQWASHHSTVLQPDPGFLMTYGLVPRPGENGIVYWDDPQAPRPGVVIVSAPSVWNFPLGTHAYVSIDRDFLQDYLTLRHMALFQMFWEIRWAKIDADIKERLRDQEGVNVDFDDRCFQLGRYLGEPDTIYAQVWGARLIARPGALPITSDSLDNEGLVWPGIDKPVTNSAARALGILNYVYVDDTVLAEFEGRREYRVHPESGSVTYGTQWSVSGDRVGRNFIRLELRKLYEGVPPRIVRHWHRFAVAPVPSSSYPAILDEPNIAKRAKNITFAVAELGEALAGLAQSVGLHNLTPVDFVGLRRSALDYHGWWGFDTTEAVARHVPLSLPIDAFLDRCMSLDKLLVEGLNEGSLRQTLQAIGVPSADIKDFRTLKLLECVVRLAGLARTTALSLCKDGTVLWDRLAEKAAGPGEPPSRLFALHDLRILKGHKAGNRDKRLRNALERFGIARAGTAGAFGEILERIYDLLIAELHDAAVTIREGAR